MRVLVLGINYSPEETGIAPFNTGRCEYLAGRGHEVRMCTGLPYYPAWRIRDEYRGHLFTREAVNGVTVLRSYLYVPRRVTAVRRILHEASFVLSASLRALLGPRPDVLFVVSPPLGLALPAVLLSRRSTSACCLLGPWPERSTAWNASAIAAPRSSRRSTRSCGAGSSQRESPTTR